MAKIVLASASPRRAELMRRIGLENCLIDAPNVSEETAPGTPPGEVAAELSRRKADAVAPRHGPGDVIIAADTVVWKDGDLLGKPESEADAVRMLSLLSGGWHRVYTGVTVRRGAEVMTVVEETSVLIKDLSPAEIGAYAATGEPMDKAGAYGIQEKGALIVERVDGDFYNVMGLPLCRLGKMLGLLGIRLMGEDCD